MQPVLTWTATRLPDWTVHIHPDNDGVAHELTSECICLPTPDRVTAADGGDNWVYTHGSLDGREQRE